MDDSQTAYAVKLPAFEGPLDLLLHLIKKNEINIYDIPISLITGPGMTRVSNWGFGARCWKPD